MGLASRTGKVIALGRLLLAFFILLAMFPSIDGPLEHPELAMALGAAYAVFSTLILIGTWFDWWLEHRLRLLSHLVDLGFFLALSLATGSIVTSPFFIFFVYLVLSAASRWGWRAGLLTGAAATVMFASDTFAQVYGGQLSAADFSFAVVRGGHLIVLSLMLSWFGVMNLAGRFALTRSIPRGLILGPPAEVAVEHLAECLNATQTMVVWPEPEEPWDNITSWTAGRSAETSRAGPQDFEKFVAPELNGRTFLFDLARKHVLVLEGRRLRAIKDCVAVDESLARCLGLVEGVATPLESGACKGYLFASGISTMSGDDIPIARKAGLDISHSFDRWEATRATAEVRENETRLRVARDLHDSVAQIMAGIGLKLRAARTTAASEEQRDEELRAIEEDLVVYQQQVQIFIDNLRRPDGVGARVDLEAQLSETAAAMRRQWPIEIDVTGDHLVPVSRLVAAEIDLLMREAVSNSVRHGKATRLSLSAEIVDGCLRLLVRDNGGGFRPRGRLDHTALLASGRGPRSIIERVEALGGRVELASDRKGALVSIKLPLETKNL